MKKYAALGTLLLAASFLPAVAQAADWSDTWISWSYGDKFGEPFEGNDISKNILSLTHVSGYKYGTNFFNIDMLNSDSKDPASGGNQNSGAQEAYIVYRNTLDFGKITGKEFKYGPIKGIGATVGFDWNTKNDNYGSRKRMLVAGPTLMWDVPGYLNTSILALRESNAPDAIASRYTYDTHAMLDLNWGIPIGSLPLSFEGYADFIASKGKDEFGGDTAPETNIDLRLMWDAGTVMGMGKNTFKIGLEYQYWKNKFGNDHNGPAGDGAFAKTPMVRAEYHF
jgi:hypothetical protein